MSSGLNKGARNARDGRPVSIIPEDVRECFDETDIARTFEYLFKTFQLSKKWKEDFEKMYSTSSREFSQVELFVRYGKEYWEPAINKLLHRDPYYPTWINLVRFIVKDKIEILAKERGKIMKMYGKNPDHFIRHY